MTDVHREIIMPLWPESVREHWEFYLVEGVVLMLLGVGAILIPAFVSLAVAIFLSWLFLIGGVVGAATTLMARHAPGFWWSLLSAIVTIIAGLLMVRWPFAGAVSVAFILAAYLATDGVLSILFAVDHGREDTPGWAWLAVTGAFDLLLAGTILWLLPAAAFWVLGLFIALDFLFGGASLIAMALAARHAEEY